MTIQEMDRLIMVECLKDVAGTHTEPEPVVLAPRYLTPRGAASHFRVPRSKIYWLIRSGKVPTQWIDGQRMVAVDDFLEFVKK